MVNKYCRLILRMGLSGQQIVAICMTTALVLLIVLNVCMHMVYVRITRPRKRKSSKLSRGHRFKRRPTINTLIQTVTPVPNQVEELHMVDMNHEPSNINTVANGVGIRSSSHSIQITENIPGQVTSNEHLVTNGITGSSNKRSVKHLQSNTTHPRLVVTDAANQAHKVK